MKKLIVFLFIIVLLALPCLAQEEKPEYKSIAEFDGHDWTSWIPEARSIWVLGFMTANEAVVNFIYVNPDIPDEIKSSYMMYFNIGQTNDQIVSAVDYYYYTSGDLDVPIWAAIYIVFQRNWWDPSAEK